MPIPDQRDPAVTRKALREWLASKLPDATDVEVSELSGPPSTGFSNETILFDATWKEGGQAVMRPLVARVKPTSHHLFLETEFETQFRVMKTLGENTDVPIPEMLWFEDDASWLGAPFWIMAKVEGEAPADSPPYTQEGFLFDASPEDQRRLYLNGLAAMAKVHNADWKGLGLGFLDQPHRGQTPLDQQIKYYEEYFDWARQGSANPVVERGLEWLKANRPPLGPTALCWGDSRMGNQLFHDFDVVAVLDWEMVCLGDPVEDVGWWLFLDRYHSDGLGAPRLAGFPSREQTPAIWSELTGRSVDAETVAYYEIFAGVRFSVIMIRLATLFADFELVPTEANMATNNPVVNLTGQLLAEQAGR